jgi:hypothetical protein
MEAALTEKRTFLSCAMTGDTAVTEKSTTNKKIDLSRMVEPPRQVNTRSGVLSIIWRSGVRKLFEMTALCHVEQEKDLDFPERLDGGVALTYGGRTTLG